MLQIKTTNNLPFWASRRMFAAALEQLKLCLCAQAANMLRMLILVLIGSLFVLVGLMILTGRVEIGGPIMGGVLLVGFGAAQFGR